MIIIVDIFLKYCYNDVINDITIDCSGRFFAKGTSANIFTIIFFYNEYEFVPIVLIMVIIMLILCFFLAQ